MHASEVPAYSRLQRRLHWLVVLLIASQYVLQAPMRAAIQLLNETGSLDVVGFLVTTLHTWSGVIVAGLVAYRWHLRAKHPVPVAAGQISGWPAKIATTVHISLYAVLLAMTVTGVLHYGLEWSLAGRCHNVGKWVLAALLLAHVGAAFWHHWVRRDQVLHRMMRG